MPTSTAPPTAPSGAASPASPGGVPPGGSAGGGSPVAGSTFPAGVADTSPGPTPGTSLQSPPAQGESAGATTDGFQGLVVPALLVAVPSILLLALIVVQVLFGMAWLPIVRRHLGDLGIRRRLPHRPLSRLGHFGWADRLPRRRGG
ncbi:MAG: hypothetical protein E6H96_04800 [Chloroflexi bacterium]|nr:MAG: hypothetical protein E6H96_04800 [Chloroflexota bacterium]